ncbi:STM3941 family protein [Neolewinella antarctica]|uniref:Photosystem I assembly protein Ycf4 n=1 Tax=Neolewinella antarctica TaxID=442734 RepID=A0ABX0XHM1_9BACT|nr:STM3941 family protein [Neolewinella antarctica]NJC28384.1 hypothetical protein [Neolewinella antarctica]
MDYPYQIPFSKTKFYALLAAALGFVVAGSWFVTVPDMFRGAGSLWPFVIMAIGLITILFFGVAGGFMLKMLLSDKMALEVNDEGIQDRTSAVAVGLIRWEDITDVKLHQIGSNHMILLNVRNSDDYLDKASGGLARRAMAQNAELLGTPITVNCSTLDLPAREVFELLREEWNFQRELRGGEGVSLPELIRKRNELLG